MSVLHGILNSGDNLRFQNLTFTLAIIYNKVYVQTSKLVNNDTRHGENGI